MRKALIALIAAALTTTSAVANGQTQTPPPSPTHRASVPFGIHEKAVFKVSFGGIGVGTGSAEVVSLDTIRGNPAYHLVLKVKGGIPFAHVDDTQESWLDVATLTSLRFHQKLNEVKYKRDLTIDMFVADTMWRSVNHLLPITDEDHDKSGRLASLQPLDDISFMYWARTIPLEVGKTYTVPRYFKADGNPVIVKVVRRQTVKVPAGTFNTIVIQPVIKTKGMFSEGGEAELYFSDDARRMLVMLSSKMSIGSLKLQLEKYEPGTPLPGSF